MGEPLSPDRVFKFLVDEPEPHPAYDFFAPGLLPGYAGNLNNNSRWIEADVPLLGELGVVADEPMVSPIVEEIFEPIFKAGEQMIALVVDMDEDIAMLFGDDDFEDDDSEGFDEEEVWKVNEEWLMAPVTPPLMPAVSDVEVAAGISIREIGPRVFAVEGHVQVMASQMVHAADRFEKIGAQVKQGSSAAERYTDLLAADYSFRDEQPGEHTNVV
ncbi:hypothetical protein Tco_0654691 [Tanacetum coccineum]|uniref:Uncharacterized protein n=1 Tax=Tanacetum coccineum TaxID=301880 RepID=A0ABQ4X467_9ASTR